MMSGHIFKIMTLKFLTSFSAKHLNVSVLSQTEHLSHDMKKPTPCDSAPSEDSDQPGRILIRVFAVRLMGS